jgi:proline dehydrogenase
MMRRTLLWMAGNQWLRRRLPRLWFAKRAVRRFMPGEEAEAALAAAGVLANGGITSVFTRLGENVTVMGEADGVAEHYLELIGAIRQRGLGAEVSVKLTQLGLDLSTEKTLQHLDRLAERAADAGQMLWIDMEGSRYVEATIACYERLRKRHQNAGLCLQAYLRRTAADLQRLLPLDPAIRLVKGAYAEPASHAYQSRREIDANYLALSVSMLEASRSGRHIHIGLGTHDVELIEQAADHASALGLPKTAFEVQMLYGIRSDQQRRLKGQDYSVRVLIAYGDAWYAWYLRRLAERPANVLFVLRQMVPSARIGPSRSSK